MAHAEVWWHQRWVRAAENVFAHIAAIVIGLVMMVVGLGLGVTMIMLPAGIAIGLLGVLLVVGGMFARVNRKA